MQLGLFDNQNPEKQRLPLPGAQVEYFPSWLDHQSATALYKTLTEALSWHQDNIKLFGKLVKIPRLQAWYGDPTTEYTYSGLTMAPLPWTAELKTLKHRCEHTTAAAFNSVLANWYRDGQDSMGLHADDEPELGPQPVIASVTLGQPREFIFSHRISKEKYRHVLEHGSLLVMRGDTQRHYLHGINKTKKRINGRINLTFRYVYPAMPG